MAGGKRGLDVGLAGLAHAADRDRPVVRRGDGAGRAAGDRLAVDDGAGVRRLCQGLFDTLTSGSRVALSHKGKPALLVRAPKMRAGSGMRGWRTGWSSSACVTGIGDDLPDRRIVVGKAMHEGGVGAVLQQPPHQIGEQVLVAADGRIDAARQVHAVAAHHLVIERLAHAVQALELKAFAVAGHGGDGRQRMGVVGGELRIEALAVLPAGIWRRRGRRRRSRPFA